VPSNVTVETGLSGESYVEISSGLTEGQEIIVSSTSKSGSTATTAGGQSNVLQGLGGGGFPDGGGFPAGGPPAGGGSFAPPGQ
jgi:macrolide-specific efflux system membrane fusion protein